MTRRLGGLRVRTVRGSLASATLLALLLILHGVSADDGQSRPEPSADAAATNPAATGASGPKTSRPKSSGAKTSDPQAGDTKAGDTQTSTPKAGASKTSPLKSGSQKQGVLKSRVLKAGDGKGRRAGLNESAPAVTPEREAAVMKFVEQHHPELVGLLESLKAKNSTEYERAVRDLFRVSERLAQFYGRDGQRYELELRLWQSQSRLDLLAARFKMSNNDDLRAQIQQALDEQYSLRQSLIRLERDRVADRLKKLDEQLHTFDASRDELLDRQLRLLLGKQKAATGKGS